MRPVILGIATGPSGPVALARVMVEKAPAPVPDIAGLTGEDGAFSIGTVGPGRYVVAVHADGYVPARADVIVHANDVTVQVRLKPLLGSDD
ncbi:MAG: carboxypeptidase-like regulatory domain-containing protein [Lapillicoccus sp.]